MKKTICFLLTSLLLLCAYAAQADVLTEWGIPQDVAAASGLIQTDVAGVTVGDAVVTIKEAAYDGVTAYILYTLKDTKTNEQLGTLDSSSGRYLMNVDLYTYFADKKIGWWHDGIKVNGKEYAMPLTGGQYYGSAEPGLQEYYLNIRLDQAGIGYGEAETLGLPISNPDGEDGGYLTVKLDASIKDKLTVARQDINVSLGDTVATQVETVFSPIKVYVNVKLSPDAAAVKEQLGVEQNEVDKEADERDDFDGFTVDEAFAAVSVNSRWADHVVVADKDGKPIEGMMQGFSGSAATGADMVMFEFAAPDAYPDEMYLAATDENGVPDMTMAIRIR